MKLPKPNDPMEDRYRGSAAGDGEIVWVGRQPSCISTHGSVRYLACVILVLFPLATESSFCQEKSSVANGAAASAAAVADRWENHSPPALIPFITRMVRENIPHSFEDKSRWGLTSQRWDGLHIQLDGLRLKTKRRKKTVNDGNWQMYRIELVNPDEQIDIRLANVRPLGNGRVGFDASFKASVHAFCRNSNWVKGVQLYSISADASGTVTLSIRGNVGLQLDVAKLPPDVRLDPQITHAELRLDDFRLYQVSDVGGEVAQQLGRSIRQILEDKFAESNRRLTDQLNRQIDKQKDKLSFSFHDLLASKWADLAKDLHRGPDVATNGADSLTE